MHTRLVASGLCLPHTNGWVSSTIKLQLLKLDEYKGNGLSEHHIGTPGGLQQGVGSQPEPIYKTLKDCTREIKITKKTKRKHALPLQRAPGHLWIRIKLPGTRFLPTTGWYHPSTLLQDLDNFARSLRLQSYLLHKNHWKTTTIMPLNLGQQSIPICQRDKHLILLSKPSRQTSFEIRTHRDKQSLNTYEGKSIMYLKHSVI